MIRVRQIKIDIKKNTKEELKKAVARLLKIDSSTIGKLVIHKKSIDARKKEQVYFVYEVDVEVENQKSVIKKVASKDIFVSPVEEYKLPKPGSTPLKERLIIVGSGPAGLFAAYILSECGYSPLVIERGEDIENRIQTVETFWKTGVLNENSNVQFGEGGAGTFSDGKLNTLVKDKYFRMKKVFDVFVSCGAYEDILYEHKPHIGTDVLRNVIINMRKKIIQMGGEFRYNTCLTDIHMENGRVHEIEVNHKEVIKSSVVVLALGHSARDTFSMLYRHKLLMNAKPFAVGIRIEHPQDMIDEAQHGKENTKYLPRASYKLTYTTKEGRGVYSFCMCPGGYVVNASSENGKLAINGMSNHARDTKNANSAIVVSVSPKDYGLSPLDGIHFQRELEEKAYQVGQGKIPVQLLGDFLEKKASTSFGDVEPIFKGDYTCVDMSYILPSFVVESLKEAIPYFGEKIQGFDRSDAVVAAIESRTSSPLRIERNEQLESSIKGIYPCGEGAGYAGGITTSAMDGIKVAEAIIERYQTF